MGCEPNCRDGCYRIRYDRTYLLPAFNIYQHPAPREARGLEMMMWDLVSVDSLTEYYGTIANLVELFASGPSLLSGKDERISMAEIHSYDPLEGLNSSSRSGLV